MGLNLKANNSVKNHLYVWKEVENIGLSHMGGEGEREGKSGL